jgi:hypothetical protein
VLVQVKSKHERSLMGRPLGVEKTSRFGSGHGGQRGQVLVVWWQDGVVDGFFIEPQNQGRAWTTWEPSYEW